MMTSPDGRPVFISRVPWHLAKENHNLSSHWFCEGEACERDCHCPKKVMAAAAERESKYFRITDSQRRAVKAICDESKCEKPCRKCDRDGIAEEGEW